MPSAAAKVVEESEEDKRRKAAEALGQGVLDTVKGLGLKENQGAGTVPATTGKAAVTEETKERS
jgi:hypothetical protein